MPTLYSTQPDKPSLLLITGIMAAGKSTVAQKLAERLPNSIHLRGDLFRRMIVNGQAEMGLELSPTARKQLHLRYQIAAAAADLYLTAGFTVVYQDIIIGSDLAEVVGFYSHHPVYVIVLCPNATVVAAREANRHKTGYGSMAVDDLDHIFRAETPRLGFWLDSSQLTVDETVDAILANLDQAAVPLKRAA